MRTAAWYAIESIKQLNNLANGVERALGQTMPPSELSRLTRTAVVARRELIEAATAVCGNPAEVLKKARRGVEV